MREERCASCGRPVLVLSPELEKELAEALRASGCRSVVRIPEESTLADAGASSVGCSPPSQPDVAEQLTASVDTVVPTAADIERARSAWEAGRQELVREPWMAFAQELANERDRAAKECEALEDECATAACKLEHSHSERVDVLRAQADGCAQCAFVIRSGDNE